MLQSRRPHTRATRPIRSPPGGPLAPALGEPPLGGNPPMTRHLLIVNPASGRGTAEPRVPLLKEAVDALGLSGWIGSARRAPCTHPSLARGAPPTATMWSSPWAATAPPTR